MLLREQSVPHHCGRIHGWERQLGSSVRRESQADWTGSGRLRQAAKTFFKTRSFKPQDKVGSFLHVFSYTSNISYLVMCRWQEPVYLQRVWTIYEQYVACSLEIPVTFVMPEDATVPWVFEVLYFRWFFVLFENECQEKDISPTVMSHCHSNDVANYGRPCGLLFG